MTQQELNEILNRHEMWLDDEYSGAQAKFEGLDLRGLDFRGANLIKADFKDTDCSGLDFTGAILTCADFTGANLQDADFTEAKLKWATFYKANLTGARFNGAILEGADFRWARGIVDLTGGKVETQTKHMRKYIIPQKCGDTSLSDISSAKYDRIIEFPEGHQFAVVLAAYYIKNINENPCYYTYRTETETINAIRKYWHDYAHEVIDSDGYLRWDVIRYNPGGIRFEQMK